MSNIEKNLEGNKNLKLKIEQTSSNNKQVLQSLIKINKMEVVKEEDLAAQENQLNEIKSEIDSILKDLNTNSNSNNSNSTNW